MTPEQLAEQVRPFVDACVSRLLVQGREYVDPDTGKQRFEELPLPQLLEYAEEEAYDLANYALMCWLRLRSLSIKIERIQRESENMEPVLRKT